ncbi:hypothetical protein [Ruminococcus sp.]|uniref:hypothetical protein n=1 Tax=Ruminococcus sp. TaxID=41978 RepID=UPI0025CC8D67|nr:hypothetical protein [Ruminococcus sp.]
MVLLLSGCAVNSGVNATNGENTAVPAESAKSDGKSALIRSLREKYGEKFTFLENAGGGTMMGEHCAIFVRAESFPGDRIYAVHGIFDGKADDRDNYMAYYFREKASSYLTEIAKEVYGECRAFYEPEEEAVVPNWIGKNSDVKELLRSTKPYYYVILPSGQDMDEKDKKLDELFNKIKREEINCYFYIAYLDNDDLYNELSSARGMDKEHIIADCTLGMDKDFNIVERQWG